MSKNKVIIQGYPGSFHDIACKAYFKLHKNVIIPADSFNILGTALQTDSSINYGVMAIENSIAGTILQNYRILRENKFSVIGEIYLRIEHCLMAIKGQRIVDLKEVYSHPMAINQCRHFLAKYPHIKMVDAEDTALSAKLVSEKKWKGVGAIASKSAAKIYNLEVLQQGIEDNKQNYTRFFIIQKAKSNQTEGTKASICIRLIHEKGSLLNVLQLINNNDINLSKLQSFPIMGKLTEYFFHMDLEFDEIEQYQECKKKLESTCLEVQELGIYKKANVSGALQGAEINVLL